MYFIYYLWSNNLGNLGLKYLVRGDWKELETIWLGSNKINDKGIKYLAKADWSHLTELNLSKIRKTQIPTKYLFIVSKTFRRVTSLV